VSNTHALSIQTTVCVANVLLACTTSVALRHHLGSVVRPISFSGHAVRRCRSSDCSALRLRLCCHWRVPCHCICQRNRRHGAFPKKSWLDIFLPRQALQFPFPGHVAVRAFVFLFLVLACVGQVAVRLDFGDQSSTAPPSAVSQDSSPQWVHTAHGWERLDSLRISPPAVLALHPGIVAVGLLCGSVLALLAWDRHG
jgi:hypothetical protein